MNIQNEQFRNCTVSFRTTSQHKLQLNRLSESSGMTLSEYLLHVVSSCAAPLDQLTGEARVVSELREELRKQQLQNNQLNLKLENADKRVEIEQENAVKHMAISMTLNETIINLEAELAQAKSANEEARTLLLNATKKEARISPPKIDTKPTSEETDDNVLARVAVVGIILSVFGTALFKR
jgi:uncharacterized membrane-anchored protein YhcB (DUF1043 family)